MKPRILVIGGLAAGPGSASKAKRVNPNAEVILFEQGEHISYGICEIPYYISNTITDAEKLISYTPQRLEQVKGVKVKILHRVEEILPVKKYIVVRDLYRDKLQEHKYDRLIIATGSKTRHLGLQGEGSRNVFHIKTLEDGYGVRQFIDQEKPRKAVIIGGGYVGMEMCEALISTGTDTTLVHLGDLPMSGLELETREAVLGALQKGGVHFEARQTVRQLKTDQSGKVVEIVTSSGILRTDLVILSLGVEPNAQLASAARVRIGAHGGILTDQRQATNIDTIFAAGDCCEVKNLVNNKWMFIPLATNATRQAWVAGENAAGGNVTFKGAIRAIAVKVFDLEVAQVGISSSEAESSGFQVVSEHITGDSKISFFPGNAHVHITAIADKRTGRLLGANVFGGNGAVLRANALGIAIQQKMTLDEISRLDLIYAPPFAPLWDPVLVAANQLKKRMVKSK